MFSIPSSSPARGFHGRSPLSPTILSTSPCVVFPVPQRLLPSPNCAPHPCRAPPLPCATRVLLGSSSRCSPWPRRHRPRPALPCPALRGSLRSRLAVLHRRPCPSRAELSSHRVLSARTESSHGCHLRLGRGDADSR